MKKLIIILALPLLYSCSKKEYECSCDLWNLLDGHSESLESVKASSKEDASDECRELGGSESHSHSKSCELRE